MENLAEFNLFTTKNFVIYLIIINLITLLGGGIGTISGMYTFRHKTKKPKFTIGMPAILILEVVLFIYLKFIM